jgi:4-phytase/acid phosphatase
MASLLGRVGGDPSRVVEANRAAFDTLEKILVGESGIVPAGKTALLSEPPRVRPGKRDHSVNFDGALQVATSIADLLVLEYGEGMPLAQVGWGRATPERITQVLGLQSLFFELAQQSSYPAKAQASNLAAHIVATLNQAATHQRIATAFGTPDQKVVVVVGHDTNLSNLGGLLGLTWWMPGTHRNPVLPGGALVFELRERRADHRSVVRVSYVAQTLEQMRNLTRLSLDQPPATAPIFVPGASGASDGFAAPLDRFIAVANSAIDPAFVVDDPN